MNIFFARDRRADIEDICDKSRLAYSYLIFLCMPYMGIMLCNSILTNRYVGGDDLFILGGTLTSPFVFIMDNIIAEIYGFQIARNVIFIGYLTQLSISLIFLMIVSLPYPHIFNDYEAYRHILGWQMFRIITSGFFAYISANLLNSYLISRWKVLVKGRYFLLRSIGASSVAEALYTLIAVFIMEISMLSYGSILHVTCLSFSIKLLYSLIFAVPSSLLVRHIKHKTGMDVYDFPASLTPFNYIKHQQDKKYVTK